MSELRVVQVISNLAWGGAQELLVLFAELCRERRVLTQVVSLEAPWPTPYEARLREAGAGVLHIPFDRIPRPGQLRALAREIAANDVVHAHLPRGNTMAAIAGFAARRPVVAGLHLPWPGEGPAPRDRAETVAIRAGAVAATACARAVRDQNRARLGGVPICLVENPAPRTYRAAGARRVRAEGPPRFVVVGRLAPEKCVDVVLRAARRLRADGFGFSLRVVGDGPSRRGLEALRASLGLEDVVSIEGARPDVAAVLEESDVYVSGSRGEGLSIALLEAMAHGLPVVATAAGDAPLLVDNAVGGLVPVGDDVALAGAMRAAAEDALGRGGMGATARERVLRSRSPEVWASRLAEIYRGAAEGVARRTLEPGRA